MKKKCPCGRGEMELRQKESCAVYNGIPLNITGEKFICPHCGIEAGTIEQTAKLQQLIAETYREKTGLLTGAQIKKLRIESGLTEMLLAKLIDKSEKTVIDWESCIVQSLSDDRLLRKILLKDKTDV